MNYARAYAELHHARTKKLQESKNLCNATRLKLAFNTDTEGDPHLVSLELFVEELQQASRQVIVTIPFEPARENIAYRHLDGAELEEEEATTKGGVDEGDRAIGSVHGANKEEVLREAELLVRPVLESHCLLPILQEKKQFSKDLRDVAAVDLVDYEHVGMAGICIGECGHLA